MTIGRDDIKINIKILNTETIIARATVILFGEWEIKGWKVLKSNKISRKFEESVWIQAPSYKTADGWKEVVYVNNKEQYNLVEEMIYDAYNIARYKNEGENGIVNEINNEDLPDSLK